MQNTQKALDMLQEPYSVQNGDLVLTTLFFNHAEAINKAKQVLRLAFNLKDTLPGIEVRYKLNGMTVSTFVRRTEGQGNGNTNNGGQR